MNVLRSYCDKNDATLIALMPPTITCNKRLYSHAEVWSQEITARKPTTWQMHFVQTTTIIWQAEQTTIFISAIENGYIDLHYIDSAQQQRNHATTLRQHTIQQYTMITFIARTSLNALPYFLHCVFLLQGLQHLKPSDHLLPYHRLPRPPQ
ncbi:MAG: hypothetical protein Q4A74_07255 [Cardiobacteriaceae bacterium]|nr:hypothetical protein [Cardiobacteriaceae bacterium]